MKERERERILRVLSLTHRKLFSTRRGCFTLSASHIHDHTATAPCNFNSEDTLSQSLPPSQLFILPWWPWKSRSRLWHASERGQTGPRRWQTTAEAWVRVAAHDRAPLPQAAAAAGCPLLACS